MKVYWAEADVWSLSVLGLGVGVTAIDEADALQLIAEIPAWYGVDPASPTSNVRLREVRDIDELDAGHVRPNMGNFLKRGVWYPNLNPW